MIRQTLFLFSLTFASLMAADPDGVIYWPKGVAPTGAPPNAKYQTHALSLSHRDKNGMAEVHQNQTDVMFVQSGEAALVLGGQVENPKTTGPGEIQGTAITNGVKKNLSPGDVINIPAGTPHQFFVEPGKQIVYSVVKVNSK
jgi:mannose-6-phosphate isomerase-like protein (cupin superfamily)